MIQQEQQLADDGFDGGEEMKREGVSQQLDGEKESESDEGVRGVKMMETQLSSQESAWKSANSFTLTDFVPPTEDLRSFSVTFMRLATSYGSNFICLSLNHLLLCLNPMMTAL
ncbi:hypothetical protein NQZ68_011012 [Dissostichus eleginoides]|nr:hypothetical protein NQZ68_011012 [Dissostichus eleginoides]